MDALSLIGELTETEAGGLGAMIVMVFGAIVAGILKLMKKREESTELRRAAVISEYREVFEHMDATIIRLQKELDDLRDEVTALRNSLGKSDVLLARRDARIEYLEDLLNKNKISFQYGIKEGSDTHSSLPPGVNKDRRHNQTPDGPRRRQDDNPKD